MVMEFKKCRICGVVKSRDSFYANKRGNLGSYCKPCHYQKTRETDLKRKAANPKPKKVSLNIGPCAFGPCEQKAKVGGYCAAHWRQKGLGQELKPVREVRRSKIEGTDEFRLCTNCEIIKKSDEFYRRGNGTLQGQCKTCMVKNNRFNCLMREGDFERAVEKARSTPGRLGKINESKALEAIKRKEFER